MTQITIRQVDDELASQIKKAAVDSEESMNSLLLRMLRRHFLGSLEQGDAIERNDLSQHRKGWIEDPECDAALREFGKIDSDDWK